MSFVLEIGKGLDAEESRNADLPLPYSYSSPMQDTPQCKGEIWLGAKILVRTLEHQNLRAATFKFVAYHNKIFEILTVS